MAVDEHLDGVVSERDVVEHVHVERLEALVLTTRPGGAPRGRVVLEEAVEHDLVFSRDQWTLRHFVF